MKNSPPHHLNAASTDRGRLAQRSAGDGERTKAVLLLIDCKISRASQWDQRKTAADGAGPDTLVEELSQPAESLPTIMGHNTSCLTERTEAPKSGRKI